MTTIYEIGPFRLDPKAQILAHGDVPVPLGPRAIAVLTTLVEHAHEYVAKAQILDAAWPGVVVGEANLAVQISAIRRALAQAPGGDQWIETLSRRGYRFVGTVAPLPEKMTGGADGASPRSNLPEPLTSFVGRKRELAEIRQLLPEARLLTLTGTGGIGKTRLALEIAAEVRDRYSDGVWFVDLAPTIDPALVPSVLAQVMRVKESAGQPIVGALCSYLRTKEVLLLLDNCEHVLDSCASMVEALLREAGRVTIVATSRERLHIRAERTYQLGALTLPGPNADAPGIAAADAVQLFVDRARQYRRSFDLQAQRARAVADICIQLDGIPLAMELAAARVAVLPVEEIVRFLDQRFRLLSNGNRSGLQRHQTLRAVINWSYELLGEDERKLFARLSVFAGGWTLAGAEAVGAGEAISKEDVVHLSIALIEKSLVVVDENGNRHRFLETVRQYALECLNESCEGDHVRTRHLAYYLALAETAEAELVGPKQGEWLARLDHERENFLAAHHWCDHARGGAELGLRLAFSLKVYFLNRGMTTLGHRITVEALMRPKAKRRNLVRCRGLWAASEFSYFMGCYGDAREHVEASLAIALEIRDEGRAAEALRLLGYVVLALGDSVVAQEHFRKALALSRRLGDKVQLSKALNGLAALLSKQGEPDKAKPLFEESLALVRELGDRSSVAIGLANLAEEYIELGLADRARGMLREGLAIAVEIDANRIAIVILVPTTMLAAYLGDWKSAVRLNAANEALSKNLGLHREPAEEAAVAPFIAQALDALGAVAFAASEASGRSLSYDEAINEASSWLQQDS